MKHMLHISAMLKHVKSILDVKVKNQGSKINLKIRKTSHVLVHLKPITSFLASHAGKDSTGVFINFQSGYGLYHMANPLDVPYFELVSSDSNLPVWRPKGPVGKDTGPRTRLVGRKYPDRKLIR